MDIIKLKKKKYDTQFKGIFHRVQDSIIGELETFKLNDNNKNIDYYKLFQDAIINTGKTNDLKKLSAKITEEIRKITKFDRVLIYRFENDGSGVVIAENKREDIESYLGLHYPYYDIPNPARQFFSKKLPRMIPNIHDEPIPILPRKHPLKKKKLDLQNAFLRSIAPCHIEYLKNMGVTASFNISLLKENKLWGLIACHHYSPKYVIYEIRKICELLGEIFSLKLMYEEEKSFRQYRQTIKEINKRIKEELSKNKNKHDFIDNIIQKNGDSFLKLISARGIAICLDNKIFVKGNTPKKKQIKALINDFLLPKKKDVFFTDILTESYPISRKIKEIASGILAISLAANNSTYHIIWFRPEQTYEVQWAGNPYDVKLITDSQGNTELCPRNSFLQWKEIVTGKSLPWKSLEIDAAEELRGTLLLAVLGYSQSILEETTRKANQANLAKGQFLAKMSHELRTPLNAILGFAQIIDRDNSLSSEQQKYVGIINRSGEHLLSLINDVLEMSRIEAGQLILHQNYFDLYKLIQSVQELLSFKESSQEISLDFHIDSDIPQYLEGDESKLRQIIVNLVGNAIKFTQVGQIDVHLCLLSYDNNSRDIELQLQVKDTGVGIKKENLETIFEPFKQTEKGGENHEGTGLGLSISRQFARLMEGDITVESELGKGSIFTCTLKMMVQTKIEDFVKQPSKQIIGLQPSQTDYRILVVEDVKDNQLLMMKILSSVGFEVRSANNGQEALEMWQKWHPQLIWMDMRMPVMDGYEASRRIRQLEAENPNRQTPVIIIALTATAFDEERKAILEIGCNDFVLKPFKEAVIFEKMKQYLGLEYVYQESTINLSSHGTVNEVDNFEQLNAEMEKMPKAWVEELRKTALSAREKNLIHLIQEIPEQYFFLADSLNQMLEELAFEKIVNLTEGFNHE
ncbi:Phytochrome, two-component sensor histidine kinase [Crocosphaera watsonii WH 0003]|uniref:Circadian input-output histidine kinase CikA n=2 Tax=Crocosphaera watsonii TaxID=263511 RepID=G5JC40_CROWT|nr:Phytochrome, two-component sensor histidine kinase [Crocosphaera watsonii WH 0003]